MKEFHALVMSWWAQLWLLCESVITVEKNLNLSSSLHLRPLVAWLSITEMATAIRIHFNPHILG
jgi:hypothetical protein